MPRRKPAEDEPDLPVRGKVTVPKKSAKKRPPVNRKPPAKKVVPGRRQAAPENDDDTDGAIDSMGDEGPQHHEPVMEGLAQHSRRSLELEAQMHARLTGQPVFPYPPELLPELRPYWQELVNSFPKDHFQVSDTTMMKMYCQCAYDIERQSLMISEEGEIVVGARGQAIVNPRCKVRESNRATLLILATKFRNQPASRVNTENFKNRRQKAEAAVGAANAIQEDADDLLASPEDGLYDSDLPPTRH